MKLDVFLKNRSVKNAGYLIAGKVVQMVFSLFIGLLTARYLGPSNYGLINYAAAYTAFFTSLCVLGINFVIVKEIIDHPEDDGTIVGTALGLQAVSSFLSSILIISIVCIVDAGETETIIVVALASVGMFFHISDTLRYWFQAKLESKVTAAAMLTAYIISSAYKVFLLVTNKSVVFFASVSSLEYACFGLLMFRQYKKYGGTQLRFSRTYAGALLRKSCHFILPGLMVAIYGQTDKLMLKQMIGDAEVGFYATAVTLCNMWCFVLSAIIESMYPAIMEAAKEKDEQLFRHRNIQLYTIVIYFSVAVSLLFSLFARPIIIILYGESYLAATGSLRIITWHTAFSYLGVARNAWIVSQDKQKYLLRIYVAAAVTNVGLNCLLIPPLGAIGAAAASLAAQIVTTMVMPFFIVDLRMNAMMMLEAMNPMKLCAMVREIREH